MKFESPSDFKPINSGLSEIININIKPLQSPVLWEAPPNVIVCTILLNIRDDCSANVVEKDVLALYWCRLEEAVDMRSEEYFIFRSTHQ